MHLSDNHPMISERDCFISHSCRNLAVHKFNQMTQILQFKQNTLHLIKRSISGELCDYVAVIWSISNIFKIFIAVPFLRITCSLINFMINVNWGTVGSFFWLFYCSGFLVVLLISPDTVRLCRKVGCVTMNQIQDLMHYGYSVVGEASYIRSPCLYN